MNNLAYWIIAILGLLLCLYYFDWTDYFCIVVVLGWAGLSHYIACRLMPDKEERDSWHGLFYRLLILIVVGIPFTGLIVLVDHYFINPL